MTILKRSLFYELLLNQYALPIEVAEVGSAEAPSPRWSERHLQCVWFDDRLRPAPLATADQQRVTVRDPGRWNLEAGPDFHDAVIELDDGRQIKGDVEIHVHPRDWDAHGHARNPLYANLIAHVTYFIGPAPATLPTDTLHIPLATALQHNKAFSFDDIDIAAYPHAILPATPRPCTALLANDPDKAARLLEAAGEFRIKTKAQRLLERFATVGDRRQVFYEETMAALGYKRNVTPFRHLAQRLPLCEWHPQTATLHSYARLLGTAGLLPSPDTASDDEAATLIRSLWDIWWRNSGEAPPLPAASWQLHGLRPHNHPIRRLAAAAALFSGQHSIIDRLLTLPTQPAHKWFRAATLLLESCARWPLWDNRLTLHGAPTPNAGALLGQNRSAAMITNIVIPWLVAENRLDTAVLDHLPPEDISEPIRATAYRLLGRDHNPAALYVNSGLRLQGLLQIYADFCLNARVGCDDCRLVTWLAKV